MTKNAINTLTYDNQTAKHASAGIAVEWELIDDAKRLGGIASKAFRTSYLVGTIAGILKGTLNDGAELLSKKAPLAKDADPEKKKVRRAKIKAGEVIERTVAEQNMYVAAGMRLSRFCKAHSITPANSKRGKQGKSEQDKAGKEVTPKANNAASANKFMRQQCAMMLAYCEKNRVLLPDAMRRAVAKLDEEFRSVPENE